MNFEELQNAWRKQDAPAKVSVNADVLLKEVRRNQQSFRAAIFWRDFREVAVALFMTVYFVHRGLQTNDWTDCLVGFACFGVGSFMITDRFIQNRRKPRTADTLKCCVESSLLQVNHQIWLLRNVFWWYLLPIILALGVSLGVQTVRSMRNGLGLLPFALAGVICVFVYGGVYKLNQYAVKKSLEPRRQELQSLLANLEQP